MTLRVGLNEQSQAEWNAKGLEHTRYEYALGPDDVVFDIGSYRGEWAREIYNRYRCKLVCFDPGSWMDFKECEFINAAAATYNGKMSFGGAYYYSSALEDPNTVYPCVDINRVLAQYPKVTLCKVNIEGGEFGLIRHMIDGGMINRIVNLQVQFHEVQGAPYQEWYEDVAKRLSESFDLEWKFSFCWESWRSKEC